MTTINLSVKRPKADGSLDPVRGSAEFSPVRRRFDAPACSRSSCATSRHGDAAMNGNPANPVLTAHLTAGSYTLKIRASSGKTYANAHLGARLYKTN